jgi:membrane protein implicated in regulation of membrane protease activity
MGRGLIAKCWRAFAIGIFVIGFGEAALWALGRYFPGWLVATLDWYVWFPAAAVFALAPAHCVAAVRRATGRVTRPSSDLPVRAFPRTVPAN